jgi:hypothetical protein
MSAQMITSTEATRHFSDILNKVHYQGQSLALRVFAWNYKIW